MFRGSRILVAPLDWGLGHATRCIPIIRRALELDAVPIIAADNAPLELLRAEFPQLQWVKLEGRPVKYSKGRAQVATLAFQLPALLRSIATERERTKAICTELQIDAIISDQRFGVRHAAIPGVLLTHQLYPQVDPGRSIARWLNHRYIDRFDRCWIVDHPGLPGLAGELSHGINPDNSRYIGPLSRFSEMPRPSGIGHRIVSIISGPEPQRSLLEKTLIEQMSRIEGDHLLLKGVPGAPSGHIANIRIVPHLSTEAIAHELVNADLVVGRCGYSTLMDLDALGLNALLIPTPGQPEQEYLARLHSAFGTHIIQDQFAIDLKDALSRIGGKRSRKAIPNKDLLEEAFLELSTLMNRSGGADLIEH